MRRRAEEQRALLLPYTAWGHQAEVANEYLAKGRQVYVEGRLRLEEYTDREGNPRTSAEVNASEVHFLGQRGAGTNGNAERADEINQADEEAEIVEIPKSTSSKSGKRSGSRRAPAKEEADAEELGVVADGIPF